MFLTISSALIAYFYLQNVVKGDGKLFVYPKVFSDEARDEFVTGSFPESFEFGSATAAYQIEGAWNVDGKGPNIWDTWSHDPAKHVFRGETGDDADKSYYLWDRDVQMMQEVGAKFYRYSISWARVLPTGEMVNTTGVSTKPMSELRQDLGINWKGVEFYNETINKLLNAGIEPMVTLFHWDLPQGLQDKGGQIDPSFPKWFSVYAELCFRLFGDRVKNWITFNEPQTVANCYEYGNCAPGVHMPGVGAYMLAHQWLLAHQSAWHIYDQNYRPTQQGKVGFTICAGWSGPYSDSKSDQEAAQRSMEFSIGWFMSPLIGTGNYPQVMIDYVGQRSKAQGYKTSRLPTFSPEEQKLLLGATDFFGLNYYTSSMCQAANESADPNPSTNNDQDVLTSVPKQWPHSASSWLRVVPYGIRNMLNWVQNNYNNYKTPWFITENGYSSEPSDCDKNLDVDKTQYLVSHVNEIYKAIQDGVNIQKYIFWSLMDNFEWNDGYSKKFGIYCVDFNDENRNRTARYSAKTYGKIIAYHGFDNHSLIDDLLRTGVLSYA